MTLPFQTICVAGAGTMGAGIAQVTAQAGYRTILFDIDALMLQKAEAGILASLEALVKKQKITAEQQKACLSKLEFTADMSALRGDLVIEAIIEREDIKHDFFIRVAGINATTTVLATNTSSIPVTRIARVVPNPSRVL